LTVEPQTAPLSTSLFPPPEAGQDEYCPGPSQLGLDTESGAPGPLLHGTGSAAAQTAYWPAYTPPRPSPTPTRPQRFAVPWQALEFHRRRPGLVYEAGRRLSEPRSASAAPGCSPVDRSSAARPTPSPRRLPPGPYRHPWPGATGYACRSRPLVPGGKRTDRCCPQSLTHEGRRSRTCY
jgi:hypothetical protein